MTVVFPIQPFGQKVVTQAFFIYDTFVEINSTEWATVPPLPSSCYEPLDLCSTLYPNGAPIKY
jgi:hypothetical protein